MEYGIPYSKLIPLVHSAVKGERPGLDSGQFCPNRLTSGHNCPILACKPGGQMDKRDRFVAEIRAEARAIGLSFRVDYRKGKGGHAMVYVGDKLTTLPSREMTPRRRERSESIWG
jgi:hypothetical protein